MRYDFSYAGDGGRRDIRELQFAPIFNWALPDDWFLTFFTGIDKVQVFFGVNLQFALR